MCGYVLNRGHVFVAAFNLEAAHAGIDQRIEVKALVVVLEAQHVFVVRNDLPSLIFNRERQTAFLRTVATVGTATGVRMTDEALTAIGNA